MKRLRYILQHRYYTKIIVIIFLMIMIIYTKVFIDKSIYNGLEEEFEGVVYKIKMSDSKRTIYIDGREKLVINDYLMDTNIKLGDKIRVNGVLKKPNNNTIPNQFNYKKYLYYNRIYYLVEAEEINIIEYNTNVLYYVKEKIINRIDKVYKSQGYLKIFLLGDSNDIDDEVMKSFRNNGISHLFSISGMHISLFASVLLFGLKRISYNNYYNYGMVIIFLLFYTILVGATPSVVRSLVMYVLFSINKVGNLKISKIDLMLWVLFIMLIIDKYYLYNMSFQFSYLISFSLIIFNYKLKYIKKKIVKNLYISLISFLVSFPICIYNFYQVNFISILLNLIMVPLVSLVIFPLSLISFIIPWVSYILNFFIMIFENISLLVANSKIGIIEFSRPDILLIIIYYALIYLFLYNYKYIYIFIMMVIHKNYLYFNNSVIVTFLDVGQGDSIFIQMPYNKGNILVDTGGVLYGDYSIVLNKTLSYFKSIGINRIDKLILTHGDYDHMGDAADLVENFKVGKVILNNGEYNDLEVELIKVLERKNIPYYKNVQYLSIGDNKLYFLNNKIYDNENDNSIVLYIKINNYKLLLMGDAGVVVEEDLINKYNLSNIDVIKVGHHGSKTSSSEKFIDYINPKYGVISVGENNRYGHPNTEVLSILDDSNIYRTDQNGSIMFKIKKDKLVVSTCPP